MLRALWRLLSGLCLLVALLLAGARSASAQAPDEAAVSEARQLFLRGSDLFLARKFSDALDSLRASYNLVPSPNSGLVIARCLRELGRPVEALETFASVESEARRRVAGGESKYAKTASSAATEGAEMRAAVGSLRIRIGQPTTSTELRVDDVPRTIPPDGVATVWHAPGEARVSVRRPDSPEQTQAATVPAGGEVQMEFGGPTTVNLPPVQPVIVAPPVLPPVGPKPPPPEPVATYGGWARSAAWVTGITTVVGFGVFTGFGLATMSEYKSLQSCAPHCDPNSSQHGTLEAGERNELIANAGVVVGSIAAAATLTFIVLDLSSSTSAAPAATPSSGAHAPRLRLGLGAAALEVPW
jgi:hypothetical protein